MGKLDEIRALLGAKLRRKNQRLLALVLLIIFLKYLKSLKKRTKIGFIGVKIIYIH